MRRCARWAVSPARGERRCVRRPGPSARRGSRWPGGRGGPPSGGRRHRPTTGPREAHRPGARTLPHGGCGAPAGNPRPRKLPRRRLIRWLPWRRWPGHERRRRDVVRRPSSCVRWPWAERTDAVGADALAAPVVASGAARAGSARGSNVDWDARLLSPPGPLPGAGMNPHFSMASRAPPQSRRSKRSRSRN